MECDLQHRRDKILSDKLSDQQKMSPKKNHRILSSFDIISRRKKKRGKNPPKPGTFKYAHISNDVACSVDVVNGHEFCVSSMPLKRF